MKIMQQPIENCYWVVPGKFLAGEYPRNKDEASSRAKIDALISSGVTNFIDLTEEDENLLPYKALLEKASHERFPIRDVSVPNSPGTTVTILDTIDRHIWKERIVYLHCWGGIGRTGMIVGCWLARHGLEGELALLRLRELWRQCPKSSFRKSPETKEQERYILNWKKDR